MCHGSVRFDVNRSAFAFCMLHPNVGQALTIAYLDNCIPAGIDEQAPFVQYMYALFISTSHLFCLGYGLASMPGTYTEMWVTLVSMIIGSVLFLMVVGTLPTAVLESEVAAAAQELDGDNVPLPSARYVVQLIVLCESVRCVVSTTCGHATDGHAAIQFKPRVASACDACK